MPAISISFTTMISDAAAPKKNYSLLAPLTPFERVADDDLYLNSSTTGTAYNLSTGDIDSTLTPTEQVIELAGTLSMLSS